MEHIQAIVANHHQYILEVVVAILSVLVLGLMCFIAVLLDNQSKKYDE